MKDKFGREIVLGAHLAVIDHDHGRYGYNGILTVVEVLEVASFAVKVKPLGPVSKYFDAIIRNTEASVLVWGPLGAGLE